jgi:hypothetical protein
MVGVAVVPYGGISQVNLPCHDAERTHRADAPTEANCQLTERTHFPDDRTKPIWVWPNEANQAEARSESAERTHRDGLPTEANWRLTERTHLRICRPKPIAMLPTKPNRAGEGSGSGRGRVQNSILRKALMPMRRGTIVPTRPMMRLDGMATPSQKWNRSSERTIVRSSLASWPAK